MTARVWVAAVSLFAAYASMVTAFAVLTVVSADRPLPPALPPIASSLGPNEVDAHFKDGAEKSSFAQADLGLPKDGRCWQYTNGVSWRAILCLGTQPEAQP